MSYPLVVDENRIQEDQQLVTGNLRPHPRPLSRLRERGVFGQQLGEVNNVERRAGVIQFARQSIDQVIGGPHSIAVGEPVGRGRIEHHGHLGRAAARLADQLLSQRIEAPNLLHHGRIVEPAAGILRPKIAKPQGGTLGQRRGKLAANGGQRFGQVLHAAVLVARMQMGARVGLDHVNLAAQVKRHGGRAQAAVLAHLPPLVAVRGGKVIDDRGGQEPLDFQVPALVLRQHFEKISVVGAETGSGRRSLA